MATDDNGNPHFRWGFDFFEPAAMSFPPPVVRRARVTPRKLHIALPLLIMAAFYWLSSLPVTPLPENPALRGLFHRIPSLVQNTLHIPTYAALAWTTWWALGAWLRGPSARLISACAIASTYGVLDEWHQSFVPGRHSSLIDVTLDVAGAVLGIWFAVWIGSRARTIKSDVDRDEITPKT